MQQIDVTIARLKLLLAEVDGKLATARQAEKQCDEQLRRMVRRCAYSETSLDGVLGMMADVAERMAGTQTTVRNLEMIRVFVASEVESLQLTRGIEQAKIELRNLQSEVERLEHEQSAVGQDDRAADLIEEIRRLRQMINEASERAARTLQQGPEVG